MVLVGNKIDLRGGEVSNEGLEAEIRPIMNEFKVCTISEPFHVPNINIISTGGGDMRGMLSESSTECLRSILFCSASSPSSNCTFIRLSRTCKFCYLPWYLFAEDDCC